MNFFLLFLSIAAVGLVQQANGQCAQVLDCEHSGNWNSGTCQCECFPGYMGNECEFADCTKQSSKCVTQLPAFLCTEDQQIYDYCPAMCNAPICRCRFASCKNGGFFDSNQCQCFCQSGFSGIRCEQTTGGTTSKSQNGNCPSTLNCLNGGKFNTEKCVCECNPNYSGTICQDLQCNSEPTLCKGIQRESACQSVSIFYYCPITCGLCANQQTPSSSIPTTTVCSIQDCFNGGFFDSVACKCRCPATHTGKFCETPIVRPATPPTTTTIQPLVTQPTQPQPQVTTPCSFKSCQYGFTFDQAACKCNCPPGFSGDFCGTYDCSLRQADSDDCVGLSCDFDAVKGICPSKCLCKDIINPCKPCYNDGILDTITCTCKCDARFLGNRCEIPADPCAVDDRPECTQLNCTSATDNYYKCSRKCVCCLNKECPTNTVLKASGSSKCECQCQNPQFDETTGCTKLKATVPCEDSGDYCGQQFEVTNCQGEGSEIVREQCPKMCGLC